MNPEDYMDEIEMALGTKIKDRKAFMTAFRGLVSCCSEDEGGDTDEEDEDEGQGKGLPGVAIMLGKMSKKGK